MKSSNRSCLPRGTTTIELLVSFSLLTAVLGVALPLVVRHGRILSSARQYRIALDELSNQAERLAAVDRDDAMAYVDTMKPSEFALQHLPDAELSSEVVGSDPGGGERVTLSLVWDEPGRRAAPVRLVTWLPRETEVSDADAAEESP